MGVAVSLNTAGDGVRLGVGVAAAVGCGNEGMAMPRSPTRMTRPMPKSAMAVIPLAAATAPIRSSACLTTLSNDRFGGSQWVGPAYPAHYR